MIEINSSLSEILAFQKEKNIEIFKNVRGNGKVQLFISPNPNIVMSALVDPSDVEYTSIENKCNIPVRFYDRREVSHNFANNSSWPSLDNSEYIIQPNVGKKFIVTFIQIRFPKKIKLKSTNQLCFSVNLWSEANQAVVPVINLQYSSVKDIVKKSNTPLNIPVDIVDDLSSDKLIEIQFKYADPDTLKGSPIVLHSSKGEFIKIWLSGNIPLKDIADADLVDETWCVINGKETIEF